MVGVASVVSAGNGLALVAGLLFFGVFLLTFRFRWIFVLPLGGMIPLLGNLFGGFPLVGIILCLRGRRCWFSLWIVGFCPRGPFLGSWILFLDFSSLGTVAWESLQSPRVVG